MGPFFRNKWKQSTAKKVNNLIQQKRKMYYRKTRLEQSFQVSWSVHREARKRIRIHQCRHDSDKNYPPKHVTNNSLNFIFMEMMGKLVLSDHSVLKLKAPTHCQWKSKRHSSLSPQFNRFSSPIACHVRRISPSVNVSSLCPRISSSSQIIYTFLSYIKQ